MVYTHALGETWMRISGTVEVAKRQAAARFKLWTTAANVRVWFDDVEVNPAR